MAGPRAELREHLRRSDFLRVTGEGRRIDTALFRVFVLDRTDGAGPRLGITVTRKVGNAVRRNRIKRLVREWFRTLGGETGSCDIVVIAKRDLPAQLGQARVQADLDRGTGGLLRRSAASSSA